MTDSRHNVVVFFTNVIGTVDDAGLPSEPCPGALEWLSELVDYFDVSIFSENINISDLQKWFFVHGIDISVFKELEWCNDIPSSTYIIDQNTVAQIGSLPNVKELTVFNSAIKSADNVKEE